VLAVNGLIFSKFVVNTEIMKILNVTIQAIVLTAIVSACVPSKKYKELVAREKTCAEELEKYRKSSDSFEAASKDLGTKYEIASKDVSKLKQDTTSIGNTLRFLKRDYSQLLEQHESLEKSFDKLKNLSAKETATLQSELEAKNKELQSKENALLKLDQELKAKEVLLKEREKRVNELEEAIHLQHKDKMEDEFGDVLFSMVNYARFLNIDPEHALARTNQKFKNRFQQMEDLLTQGDRRLSDHSLAEMDAAWNEVKKYERKK
jgi:DNA repair exonuclease SbcCD ATPase subunit